MSSDSAGDLVGPLVTPDPEQIRWNKKYRREGLESFGITPSSLLVEHESLLRLQPCGPALDVAAGNGRNALYLARLGFDVQALDISDVAVAWLAEHARRRRLSVYARWANLQIERLPEQQYEVVVNINYLERGILPALEAALRPGGLLFFQTMTTDQVDLLGERMPRRFLLAPNELRDSFPDLKTLEYQESIVTASISGTKKAVASLLARKPGPRGCDPVRLAVPMRAP
jgi:2-polyprenyl-3-methyl-5-hydroxy-6-metoxy-1,4-benzoquinol methylase